MIERELLTWRHLREATDLGWAGWELWTDNRLRYLPMIGFALRDEGGALVGVGGVVWLAKRPLGCFNITESFRLERRSRWVHRLAIKVIEAAHSISPVIYANADRDVPRSVEFLVRLGFTPEDGDIWTHGLHDSGSSSGGVVHHDERARDRVSSGGPR